MPDSDARTSKESLICQLARNLADALLADNGAKVSMYLASLSKLRQMELAKRQEILKENPQYQKENVDGRSTT